MKHSWLIVLILFSSCKPCQQLALTLNEPFFVKAFECPENADCSMELIPNKSITFKKDNTGILYPEIVDGEKTLLKYTFKKYPIPNTQDSNYSEIIYAELNRTITEMALADDDLQTLKLHFGRFCYCKGETGYFPIKKGVFKMSKNKKNGVKIDFDFTVKEVPQIITKINESIVIRSK